MPIQEVPGTGGFDNSLKMLSKSMVPLKTFVKSTPFMNTPQLHLLCSVCFSLELQVFQNAFNAHGHFAFLNELITKVSFSGGLARGIKSSAESGACKRKSVARPAKEHVSAAACLRARNLIFLKILQKHSPNSVVENLTHLGSSMI